LIDRARVPGDETSRDGPAGEMTVYKVVEASTVTDEAIERILNEWVGKGWAFDGVQFAMRESSKRPAMAFVLFTRIAQDE
jgi:hypothetical protein